MPGFATSAGVRATARAGRKSRLGPAAAPPHLCRHLPYRHAGRGAVALGRRCIVRSNAILGSLFGACRRVDAASEQDACNAGRKHQMNLIMLL